MWFFKKKKEEAKFLEGEICPLIRVTLFEKSVIMLVDTGSDLCYLDTEFFKTTNYTGSITPSKALIGASGTTSTHGRIKTKMTIGKTSYDLPMTLFDLKDRFTVFKRNVGELPVGIIGSNFLYVNYVQIDFGKNKLYTY